LGVICLLAVLVDVWVSSGGGCCCWLGFIVVMEEEKRVGFLLDTFLVARRILAVLIGPFFRCYIFVVVIIVIVGLPSILCCVTKRLYKNILWEYLSSLSFAPRRRQVGIKDVRKF